MSLIQIGGGLSCRWHDGIYCLITVVIVFNNLRKHPKESLICLWWCVLSNEDVLVWTVCKHFLIPFNICSSPTPPNLMKYLCLFCAAKGISTSWSIFTDSWPFLDLLLIHICILKLCFSNICILFPPPLSFLSLDKDQSSELYPFPCDYAIWGLSST